MLKKSFRSAIAILIAVAMVAGFSACQSEQGEKSEKETEISILYPNWAEGVAFTNLAKVALDDMGYNVKITPLEPGPIYATLAKGDADLLLDAWLPHTHADYWEKYGDKLVKLGESFSNGTTGLAVPSYVEVNSIEELNDNVDMFNGEIIGIGSGAGIHRNTEKAIEDYNLDYKQVTSSGPAMMASLQKSYAKEEPIIITGWKPHYMWAQYDLKYLEDPKGVYPKDVCAILSRQGFKEDNPMLGQFFTNFNLSDEQLGELLLKIRNGDDELASAKEWYMAHKDLVQGWMPKEGR
jgi:glycine betaine/proline transport system substrate-binding protein